MLILRAASAHRWILLNNLVALGVLSELLWGLLRLLEAVHRVAKSLHVVALHAHLRSVLFLSFECGFVWLQFGLLAEVWLQFEFLRVG